MSPGARELTDPAGAPPANDDGGLLAPLQRGLCRLYRIASPLDVRDFVIDDATRQRLRLARAPREQLLVVPGEDGEDEMSLGLFVDAGVLRRLEATPRAERVRGAGLGEFCLAVEGVSHFVYLVHCAGERRSVSALELELQAEIDKYVTCVLETWEDGPPDDLRERLFARFALEPALSDEERQRYLLATREAASYARSLETRFVRARALPDMLAELRRIFRLGWPEKVDAMHRAA